MTRQSKQGERRNRSPRKRHFNFSKKTGPKKDNLAKGFKEHENALSTEKNIFIPKIS
ncbi:MAG: hypothetical protein WDZ28_01690 [Simkaniaceae bacterium]